MKFRHREPIAVVREADSREAPPNGDELLGLVVWKRLQKHPVDHTENRAVRTHAEGQR